MVVSARSAGLVSNGLLRWVTALGVVIVAVEVHSGGCWSSCWVVGLLVGLQGRTPTVTAIGRVLVIVLVVKS